MTKKAKGVKRQNQIIEREFRKAIQLRVEREWRPSKDGGEVEVLYVILGETRYKMAPNEDGFFFTALAQPTVSFPIPEDYHK